MPGEPQSGFRGELDPECTGISFGPVLYWKFQRIWGRHGTRESGKRLVSEQGGSNEICGVANLRGECCE